MPIPFELAYTFTIANRMSGALMTITRDLRGTQAAIQATEAQMNKLRASFILAGGALLAAGAGVVAMKQIYTAGQEVTNALGKLSLMGVTASDAAKVYQSAWTTAMTVHGTLLSQNIELGRELFGIFGDLAKAEEYLPRYAEMQKAFGLLQTRGGAFSALGPEALQQVMKSADILAGPTPAKFASMTDLLFRIMEAAGGLISPEMLYAAIRQASGAGRQLTPTALAEWSEAVMELGPRAGTALQSLMAATLGGRFTKKQMEIFQAFGLAGPEFLKTGKVGPMPLVGSELLVSDPFKWVQTILVPHIAKTLGHAPSSTELNQAVNMMFASTLRTMPQLLSLIATQPERFARQLELIQKALGIDLANAVVDNTQALFIFHKSIQNLAQTLGYAGGFKAALDPMFTGLAGAIDRLSNFLQGHPAVAKGMAVGAIPGATAWLSAVGILAALRGLSGFVGGPALRAVAQFFMDIINPLRIIPTLARSLVAVLLFLATPLGLITAGFLAVAGVAFLVWKNWDWVRLRFTQAMESFRIWFHNLITYIQEQLARIPVLAGILGIKPPPQSPAYNVVTGKGQPTPPPVGIPSGYRAVYDLAGHIAGMQRLGPGGVGVGALVPVPQMATANNIINVSAGAITVNALPGQDPKEIASSVVEQIVKTAQVGFGRTPMGIHQSEAWSLTR